VKDESYGRYHRHQQFFGYLDNFRAFLTEQRRLRRCASIKKHDGQSCMNRTKWTDHLGLGKAWQATYWGRNAASVKPRDQMWQ
jgi:hypothetical protein